MSGKKLFIFLLAGMVALAALTPTKALAVCIAGRVTTIAPTDPSGGSGTVAITPTVGTIKTVNLEGRTERVDDILVIDDGVGANCFGVNNIIRITYNLNLTVPASIQANTFSATSANFDVYDNNGVAGLVILASATTGLAPGGTPQTVISVTVQQAGTAGNPTVMPGSGFRIKNLRGDVAGSGLAVAGNTSATVSVVPGATAPTVNGVATSTVLNGLVANTVLAASTGIGGANGSVLGLGTQSSNGGLTTQATWLFTEGHTSGFRVAAANPFGVFGDVAQAATSMILDAGTSIPSNVTVTFPSTLSTSGIAGPPGGGVIFSRRGGGTQTCVGPANCFVIYDTTANAATGSFGITATTVAGTSPTGAGTGNPQIGVNIGAPSGFGTATLLGIFGPGEAGGANDDVQAGAIPRYVSSTGSVSPTRRIFTGNWFTIAAVRTVLLYPYVTNKSGYIHGLTVANTGNDAGTFAAGSSVAGQTGQIVFVLYPNGAGAVPITVTAAQVATVGRGLESGVLRPGAIYAVSINDLLTASGNAALVGNFDGYVMAVTQFNFAHGQAALLGPGGSQSIADASVVGGAARGDGSNIVGCALPGGLCVGTTESFKK